MRKRLTHEEFMARVMEKNEHVRNGEIEIRGKYIDSETPVECHCNKHDTEWNPVPAVLYQGCGCSLCATERAAARYMMSQEDFLKKLYDKNEDFRLGKFKVTGIYNGANKPVECYCNIHNQPWEPNPTNLYKGYGCPLCGREKQKISSMIPHEVFVARVMETNEHVKSGEIEIRGIYNGIDESIECYCVKHDALFYPRPYTLETGGGCPYCAGHKVLVGFNDLWTTDPEVASLLTNPDDGYLIARTSHSTKSFTCPLCGREQPKIVLNVSRRGLQCSYCSNHISFPNRFSRAFLSQLPIEDFIPEYSPEWLKPYFYDNYFEYNGEKYILEMDGGIGHGNKQWGTGGIDVVGKERDMFKDQLAVEKGLQVIRIDAQESNCEYLKQHILESELSQIFDLTNIDWEKCNRDAQKNLIKEACDLYMSFSKDLYEIAKILKIQSQTVRNYLKKGVEFGWCDYNPNRARSTYQRNNQIKKVLVTNTLNQQQFVFKNMRDCSDNIFEVCGIKMGYNTVQEYCKHKDTYCDFMFELIDSTIQN